MVSIFLVLIALIAGSMHGLKHQDYLLYNAYIYTLDPSYPVASSVLVRNGRFERIGIEMEFIDESIQKIDMNNSLILPGLIDSHAHLLLQGYKMASVDLNGAKSVRQVRDRILDFIDKYPFTSSNSWIKGRGWDQTLFDPQIFPSFEDLDEDKRLVDVPIVLYRVDAHAL